MYARLKEFFFRLLRNSELLGVLDRARVPVQFNSELNREGIEPPFDQSYQIEITTDPLGPHYIIS
jgi:hypothetical protein